MYNKRQKGEPASSVSSLKMNWKRLTLTTPPKNHTWQTELRAENRSVTGNYALIRQNTATLKYSNISLRTGQRATAATLDPIGEAHGRFGDHSRWSIQGNRSPVLPLQKVVRTHCMHRDGQGDSRSWNPIYWNEIETRRNGKQLGEELIGTGVVGGWAKVMWTGIDDVRAFCMFMVSNQSVLSTRCRRAPDLEVTRHEAVAFALTYSCIRSSVKVSFLLKHHHTTATVHCGTLFHLLVLHSSVLKSVDGLRLGKKAENDLLKTMEAGLTQMISLNTWKRDQVYLFEECYLLFR